MSDEADQKFTQLKDIQVIEERISQETLAIHRRKIDQACPAHQPGRHRPGGLKDVRCREEDQKDLVVAVRLFKAMDKVRRKMTRRGERYLYSLGLYIAISLKIQCDYETPDYFISSGYLRYLAWIPPWRSNRVLVEGNLPSILLIFVSR